MNIAYSCDNHYIPQTGISIISLCENNKEVDEIVIYFIGKDVSPHNIEILKKIVENYNRKFVYIDFYTIAYDLKISSIGRHIETIYAKVFFSRIENLNKIIYLDSDTVIDGSLMSLWNEDLKDVYMGVVQTFSTKKKLLNIPESQPFFNDGMAIVNVDYCRKNNLIEKVIKVIEEYDGNPPTLSEGALNKVCLGNVKYISIKWNCMSGILYYARLDAYNLSKRLNQYSYEDIIESCNNPIVIHYLAAFYNRPWFYPCTHPFKDKYYYYKSLSPWKNEEPKYNPLPFKLKYIDFCNRFLGYNLTDYIVRIRSFFVKKIIIVKVFLLNIK